MKGGSVATLALLATGQYLKFEFYAFTLTSGTVLRFTNADIPLQVAGNTYRTGLTLSRSSCKQKMGLEVQTMEMVAAPQGDHPDAPIMVDGYPFLQAVNLGFFDGARILLSKGFFSMPSGADKLDTSPGLVAWKQGKVSDGVATRSEARINLADDTQDLSIAMPRNVVQTGCVHTLFGAGCGLAASEFQSTGSVTGSPTVSQFNTGAASPTGYYNMGRILFTSGANSGLKRTVKTYVNSGGVVTVVPPLPVAPAIGDTFTIWPGCPKTLAACSNTNAAIAPPFNNRPRFRGMPFVPVPETLYDGGTMNASVPTLGSQGGAGAGSNFSGNRATASYTP